ncbi:MAG: bacillithiol biosynthesis cysteine-adding enzyme BshC [Gemmatimonadales bacterium]|nr:bacillithiol biosynthesis cysteine-adding enzyme BshC [Gemmatimonadales bacterium]
MSLPIFDTPLAEPPSLPAPRAASWNPDLEPAIVRAPGTDPLLSRLRRPGALVVTTGQQPGLFTGPSYSVTKALSARGLACALERRWGRPVVPIFWVPGDDHDFEEVASVSWLDGEGSLLTASLAPHPSDAPLTPMSRLPLGGSVAAALDAFERSLPASYGRDEVVALLRRHYTPGATIAASYANTLAELLAPFGVLCLDSTHQAVKAAAAPLFVRALAEAPALDQLLAARSAVLVAEGKDPRVPVGDGATLVFLDGPLGRDRLMSAEQGFVTRRGRSPLTLAELERIAAAEPTRLSANVLLRPVVESALLPTVAYVAGPAELKYLALAGVVYEKLGVSRQQPVPRWSGLLVEPRVTRLFAKFGVSVGDFLAEGNALETAIARRALPPGVMERLTALREAIDRGFAPLVNAVEPAQSVDTARARALFAVERLEKKLLQHARKREATELAQVARARTSVRPAGKPQERVLSMLGFLGRYGPDLLPAVAGHIEVWFGHALEAGSATP